MKSDEEKLRELFEMKEEPTFNNTIKKAKTFSIIRTTIISLMLFIIVSSMALISNTFILNRMGFKAEYNLRNWFNVAMPNAYMSNSQADDRIMAGQIEYSRYRFLGSMPIADGSYKEGYSYMPFINGVYGDKGYYLFDKSGESIEELQELKSYNKVGKSVMKFYHPSIVYNSYINDLESLKDISDNKLAEMSLSFDQAYNLEEVKKMLPKNITLNWYWVDTLKGNEKLSEKYSSSKNIFDEYDVCGIKAIDSQGKILKDPEETFIISIMYGKQKIDNYIYKSLFEALSNGKGEITKEDLKIIGVVVSGDVETLKSLKDMKFIKAATIGAVADKY